MNSCLAQFGFATPPLHKARLRWKGACLEMQSVHRCGALSSRCFVRCLQLKSRMVVHVAVGTVEALIFGLLSINNRFDPCHVRLLIWLGHLLPLDNWTVNVTWTQEVLFDTCWTKIFPWQGVLIWICSICCRCWQALRALR